MLRPVLHHYHRPGSLSLTAQTTSLLTAASEKRDVRVQSIVSTDAKLKAVKTRCRIGQDIRPSEIPRSVECLYFHRKYRWSTDLYISGDLLFWTVLNYEKKLGPDAWEFKEHRQTDLSQWDFQLESLMSCHVQYIQGQLMMRGSWISPIW